MRKSQLMLQANQHDQQQNANGNYNGNGVGGGGGSESYSSTSSFTESYSDSSDLANWEEYVADNGTLFYAEYNTLNAARRRHRIEFARNSSLRTGKASKNASSTATTTTTTARKQQISKDKQHQQLHQQQQQQRQLPYDQDFKFSQIRRHQESPQQKQLELVITAADRYRFGRRSTAIESILGFRVVPYSDQPECLMVDGFVHDMPAMQGQLPPIKRGDWFKSLDDIEVRTSNVDELLLQFVEPTKVCLKFQGYMTANETGIGEGGGNGNGEINDNDGAMNCAGGSADLKRIENFPMFAELFEKFQLQSTTSPNDVQLNSDAPPSHLNSPLPFAMLILPPECYQNDQHRDSMFVFPELNGQNFLYKARGSFLTLNAVLGAEMQTRPLSSKLLVDDVQYFVCYRMLNSFLVLFAYAAIYQSIMEANLRSDELISYMRFALPNLSMEQLSPASESTLKLFLYNFCIIQRTRILAAIAPPRRTISSPPSLSSSSPSTPLCLFEELLRESRALPLPKEAQLRIFDALSEMEAMDYRNWNDEPLNTHREFFIHGSILYYDNFLLASQIPNEMRTRIESFLRCRGIFDFIRDQAVKELYVWEEIVPPECEGCIPELGLGRFFLTICSRSHLILAVVLKIFDAPDLAADAIIPPSLFYIEEIQETLDHLISCGIESLAMFWSISNKRPEAMASIVHDDKSNSRHHHHHHQQHDEEAASKDSNKLENFIKQKIAGSSSSSTLTRNISYDEETHLCSSLGGGSSSIHSEDDSTMSRKRLTIATNYSNYNNNDNAASDSGSDWDNFGEQHGDGRGGGGGGAFGGEMPEMTESLWKEINNVVPVKISAGWKNSVYHYVYVDNANGTVFCPLKASMINGNSVGAGGNAGMSNNNHNADMLPFLCEMRKACLIIHEVLEKTKSFRRLLAQETTNSTSSTTTTTTAATTTTATTTSIPSSPRYIGLAIKEHGMTIQVRDVMKEDAIESNSPFKGDFVVVGRLFHTPTREIYVCHRPDVPQNLVEMAFRLSFFSVG